MKEKLNKPQPQLVEKRKTMDIYNFKETSTIPPAPGEPLRSYKWVPEKNIWDVDISQSQTNRFEIMLIKNPENIYLRSALNKERQIDGFVQRLEEQKKAELIK